MRLGISVPALRLEVVVRLLFALGLSLRAGIRPVPEAPRCSPVLLGHLRLGSALQTRLGTQGSRNVEDPPVRDTHQQDRRSPLERIGLVEDGQARLRERRVDRVPVGERLVQPAGEGRSCPVRDLELHREDGRDLGAHEARRDACEGVVVRLASALA
jgi:hypothetical protein